jgi:fused signal recognition particle receptor
MAFFSKAIAKLAAGLAKTKERLFGGLKNLLTGRKLDEELLQELEAKLIEGDLGVAASRKIRADLQAAYKDKRITRGEDVIPFLKQELKGYWPPADRAVRTAASPPTVVLVVGVNGSGKTTSVAKLAGLFKSQGKKVLLAAGDTFRAAAVQQLTIWADRAGVDIVKAAPGSDPGAVVFDACTAAVARGMDYLVVDTAGRLHTQDHLMRELTKVKKVLERKIPGAPHEVLLVLDATTGQNAINQAKSFLAATEVTGIFLAKLDGTAKGGIVIALRSELNLPVKFVGIGEQADDIEAFDPEAFVEALFA